MEKRPKFLDRPLLDGEFIYLDKEVESIMDIRLWLVIHQILTWIHGNTLEENQQLKENLANLIKIIDQRAGR